MLRVLQCKERSDNLRPLVSSDEDLRIFVDTLRNGKPKAKNRVLAVLAVGRGMSCRSVSHILHLSRNTVTSYCSIYKLYGCARLLNGFHDRLRKSDDELLQNTLFSVLHTPPTAYGINRTTWRMPDLRRVLAEKGQKACPEVIREIIKAAGYSWKKGPESANQHGPQYQEKLAKIQAILSALGPNERFFSIDEYGPFAVKMQGGRSLMPPGRVRVIPQRQKSKGSLIITAALELSTNQVTHFYSEKKNTAEMIRLLEILVKQYAGDGQGSISPGTPPRGMRRSCSTSESNRSTRRNTGPSTGRPWWNWPPCLPAQVPQRDRIGLQRDGPSHHPQQRLRVSGGMQGGDRPAFRRAERVLPGEPEEGGPNHLGQGEYSQHVLSSNNCKNRDHFFYGI